MLLSSRCVAACLCLGAVGLLHASELAHATPVAATKPVMAKSGHAESSAVAHGEVKPTHGEAKAVHADASKPASAEGDKGAAAHEKKAEVQELKPSLRPLAPQPVHVVHPAMPIGHEAYRKPAVKPVRKKTRRVVHTAAALPKDSLEASLQAASGLSGKLLGGVPNHGGARAVVLACADSGASRNRLLGNGARALYVVQNQGNQLLLGEPAVTYAVRQLHVSLLLIVARADCKAVDTARRDFSALPVAEQRALLSINVPKDIPLREAQLDNLDNQVEAAVLQYGGEVESGRLSVVGAYFDAAGARGRLAVMNVNGERNQSRIATLLKPGNLLRAGNGMIEEETMPADEHSAAPAKPKAH